MALDSSTNPSLAGLAHLPAELRLHIFGFVLQHEGILQRFSARSIHASPAAESSSAGKTSPTRGTISIHGHRDREALLACLVQTLRPIHTSLLCLNRSLSTEALDVLYASNRFRVSYNHLCTCQARYPFTFDNARIRELEVVNFYPRDHGSRTCTLCHAGGSGLVSFLQNLPRLRTAVIVLDDLATFSDFFHACGLPASSEHVGSFTLNPDSKTIHVLIPPLQRAWQSRCTDRSIFSGWPTRTKFERSERDETLLTLFFYLEWEAGDFGRTAAALRPFFVKTPKGWATLQVPVGERMASFSAALAQIVGDMFLVAETMEEEVWEEGMMLPDLVEVDDYRKHPVKRWTYLAGQE